jgi:hypothetical protein
MVRTWSLESRAKDCVGSGGAKEEEEVPGPSRDDFLGCLLGQPQFRDTVWGRPTTLNAKRRWNSQALGRMQRQSSSAPPCGLSGEAVMVEAG